MELLPSLGPCAFINSSFAEGNQSDVFPRSSFSNRRLAQTAGNPGVRPRRGRGVATRVFDRRPRVLGVAGSNGAVSCS
jgi:hypothetical protein